MFLFNLFKMIKSKVYEVFSESIRKLDSLISHMDTQLGVTGNIPTNTSKNKNVTNKPAEIVKNSQPASNLFDEIDIRVGKVVDLKLMENSEDIYLLQVDLGEKEVRKIGSGIRKYVQADQLNGKFVLVFANLKPKKLGNFVSEGMILTAHDEKETVFELPRPSESKIKY